MGHLNELIRYSAMAAVESVEGPAGAEDGALADKESITIYCYDTFRDRADRIWETPFPDKRRVGTRAAALISIVLQQRDSGKDLHKVIIRRSTQRDAITYVSVKLREIIHSRLDWDPLKEKPDWTMRPTCGCTFFTCHFKTSATMDEAERQHLLDNGFQSVYLSFGDVAVEVEIARYTQDRQADWVMNGAGEKAYLMKRLTFIFGDKSQGLYRCSAGSVVYYLGRIVKGRESLLRARQLLKAAAGHAAAPSPLCISAVSVKTKKYTGSDPALDPKPQIVFLQ
ncbi:hypothetical protein RvY_12578 [Ramazzottius varieornatus]|uniref:Uncharacterized protein n=1 Tax=Ramazzottius varieornatus TaxID=947166 RepID=A0A1D1VQF5_RAMVA|nr:hypothetical protein RvY_12578 [Ramazzottius varieornatus]